MVGEGTVLQPGFQTRREECPEPLHPAIGRDTAVRAGWSS